MLVLLESGEMCTQRMDDLLGLSFQEVSGGRVRLVHSLQEWSSRWPPARILGLSPVKEQLPPQKELGFGIT